MIVTFGLKIVRFGTFGGEVYQNCQVWWRGLASPHPAQGFKFPITGPPDRNRANQNFSLFKFFLVSESQNLVSTVLLLAPS
jgi:hypothetical protein